MLFVDGVLDGFAFVAVEAERTHTHLVHVGRADNNGTSIAELLHSGRIDWSDEVFQNRGGGRRLKTLGQDVVLDSDRDSIQFRLWDIYAKKDKNL